MLKPETTSLSYVRQGALLTYSNDVFLMDDLDFLFAFITNFTTVKHQFREIIVFFRPETTVHHSNITTRGAVLEHRWQIVKGLP